MDVIGWQIIAKINRGEYINNSDLEKLSQLDIDYASINIADNGLQEADFIGLVCFTEDLMKLLSSNHIIEVNKVAHLRMTLAQHFHASSNGRNLIPNQSLSCNYETLFEVDLFGGAVDENWNPEYSDHQAYKLRYNRQVNAKGIQYVYHEANSILNMKLKLFDDSEVILDLFAQEFIHRALDLDISDAKLRVDLLLRNTQEKIKSHEIFSTEELTAITSSAIDITAKLYCNGNRALAMRRLEAKMHSHSSATGTLGIRLGAGLAFLAWALSETLTNDQLGSDIWRDPTFAMFNAGGELILLIWMWGGCVRIWLGLGIDFVALLGLRRTELAMSKGADLAILSGGVNLTLIYLVKFVVFNKLLRGVFGYPAQPEWAHFVACGMFVFLVYKSIYPVSERRVWWIMLRDVLMTPVSVVNFRDAYIGDLLTSLVKVFANITYSFIYILLLTYAFLFNDFDSVGSASQSQWFESYQYRYIIIPIITVTPLWIRMLQCMKRSVQTGQRWPYIGNALKYFSAIIVASYSLFRPESHKRFGVEWILGFLVTTLYQLYWDIVMDWGLLVWDRDKGLVLRPRRLFRQTWIYVTVTLLNVVLRFTWTLTLVPDSFSQDIFIYRLILKYFTPLVTSAEIVRRMMWSVLRLEWEHIERMGTPDIDMDMDAALANHAGLEKMDIRVGQSRHGSSGNSLPRDCSIVEDQYEWIPLLPFVSDWTSRFFYSYWFGGFISQIYRLVDCIIITLVALVFVSHAASFTIAF